MRTWLLNLWDRLRNSLWFVPAMAMIGAILLVAGMLQLDETIRLENYPMLQWATTTGQSARATLSTLAGALITMTSVVFSITMLTLAQTSAMFGSRLLRTFLNHNIAQCTLAVFLGTSLYCFAVLRAIRELGDGTLYVPHLSVAVGLLAGLASLAMFVAFIHHVSLSIQAQTIARNVADDLDDAIARLFPDPLEQPEVEESEPAPQSRFDDEHAADVESQQDGYLQAINGERLMEIAQEQAAVIRLHRRPGDFISVGMSIAAIGNAEETSDDLNAAVNECFLCGSRRTPRQDVECAVYELVEVAVRALSPGINDPHTAMACIDYLGAALVRLAGLAMPSPLHRGAEGTVRVITKPVSFADVLNAAFDEIRHYGRDSAQVTMRLVETLEAIARKATRPSDRDALMRQAAMIERGAQETLLEKYDLADVQERLRDVREILEDDDREGSVPEPSEK